MRYIMTDYRISFYDAFASERKSLQRSRQREREQQTGKSRREKEGSVHIRICKLDTASNYVARESANIYMPGRSAYPSPQKTTCLPECTTEMVQGAAKKMSPKLNRGSKSTPITQITRSNTWTDSLILPTPVKNIYSQTNKTKAIWFHHGREKQIIKWNLPFNVEVVGESFFLRSRCCP